MYQLAQQKQRRIDSNHRAPAREQSVDCSPGKRALTDSLQAGYMGEPDLYTRTIENAERELDALRSTATPNLVAIRRKRDLASLTKQVELASAAMQVRALILAANVHVYTLEAAATHADPRVVFLRNCLDRVVTRATKLGAYDGAMDMRPATYEDNSAKQNVAPPRHQHRDTTTQLSGAMPVQVRKDASNPKAGNTPQRMPMRTRTARTTTVAPVQRKSTGSAARANVQAVDVGRATKAPKTRAAPARGAKTKAETSAIKAASTPWSGGGRAQPVRAWADKGGVCTK